MRKTIKVPDIRLALKSVLSSGGRISVPYKSKINEIYGEIVVYKSEKERVPIYTVAKNITEYQEYYDIDMAINVFMTEAYTSRNFGYLQERLKGKGVVFKDSDFETPNREVRKLFRNEAKIVDKDFEDMGIERVKFPTIEEAEKAAEELSKSSKDEIHENYMNFLKKYSPLGIYSNFSANYLVEYSKGKKTAYGTSASGSLFLRRDLNRMKYEFSKVHPYEFVNFEMCIKVADGDYLRWEILKDV